MELAKYILPPYHVASLSRNNNVETNVKTQSFRQTRRFLSPSRMPCFYKEGPPGKSGLRESANEDETGSWEVFFMKELVNQRRCARFRIPAYSAYAAFRRQWVRSSSMGRIADIGLGGLSFRYIASKEWSQMSSHIDILLTDGSFCLNKMRVKRIWDLEIDGETSVSFETRQCGVQFGDLTDNQKSDLRYFIQTYTTADPEA